MTPKPDAVAGRWTSVDPITFAAADANLYRYVGNQPSIVVDSQGLKGDGHHIIPWHLFDGKVSDAVKKFWDSDEARIANEFYQSHNGKKLNEVSHYRYNQAVRKELEAFLDEKKGRTLANLTVEEAAEFLNRIKSKSGSSYIGKYLRGCRKEAREAYIAGKALAKAAAAKAAAKKGASKCVFGAFDVFNDSMRFINWLFNGDENWYENEDDIPNGVPYEKFWEPGLWIKDASGRPMRTA